MQPTPAEVARTLAAGLLLGVAYVAGQGGPLRVRHAVTGTGLPLLLTRSGGDAARALCPAAGATDTGVVLSVSDAPPAADAPTRGQVWLSGWAIALTGADARCAAIEYAQVNPTADLLGVGRSHQLYLVDVEEIRLGNGEPMLDVDLDEFQAAEPDPLRFDEHDLLAEVNARHRTVLNRLAGVAVGTARTGRSAAARVAASASVRGAEAGQAVRLDRYGLVLSLPGGQRRYARLPFERPLHTPAEVAGAVDALPDGRPARSGSVPSGRVGPAAQDSRVPARLDGD